MNHSTSATINIKGAQSVSATTAQVDQALSKTAQNAAKLQDSLNAKMGGGILGTVTSLKEVQRTIRDLAGSAAMLSGAFIGGFKIGEKAWSAVYEWTHSIKDALAEAEKTVTQMAFASDYISKTIAQASKNAAKARTEIEISSSGDERHIAAMARDRLRLRPQAEDKAAFDTETELLIAKQRQADTNEQQQATVRAAEKQLSDLRKAAELASKLLSTKEQENRQWEKENLGRKLTKKQEAELLEAQKRRSAELAKLTAEAEKANDAVLAAESQVEIARNRAATAKLNAEIAVLRIQEKQDEQRKKAQEEAQRAAKELDKQRRDGLKDQLKEYEKQYDVLQKISTLSDKKVPFVLSSSYRTNFDATVPQTEKTQQQILMEMKSVGMIITRIAKDLENIERQ